MSTLDGSIVNIAYPAFSEAFGTDASVVAWVGIAFFLTSTSLLLTMGWVGDFLGRERLYTAGLLVFTVGMGLASLALNVQQLIIIRALQGVGSAMVISVGVAILAAAFDPRERGLVFGMLGAVVGVGLASGPAIGGIVLDLLDWRAIFYTRFPLGLIAVPLSWLMLERRGRVPGALHLDVLGSTLLLLFLGGFLFSINQAGRLGLTSPLVVASLVFSLFMGFMFVRQEKRALRPIVDLRMFRNPTFTSSVLTLLAHFQAWAAVAFLLPFTMINGLGYTAVRAGLILAVFSVVRSVASPVTGWMADRFSHRILMGVGMAIVSAALLMLSQLGADATVWQFMVILSVGSLGSALFDPPNASSIMSSVPSERLGMAGASIATGRQMGLSAGIALSGAVLASRQAHYLSVASEGVSSFTQATALIQGAGDALFVSAIIAALGILPLLLGKRRPPGTRTTQVSGTDQTVVPGSNE